MKAFVKYALVLILFLLSQVSYGIPKRPNPQRLVNDYADLFSPAQENSLERTLVNFDRRTSNQITIVTVKDLEGYEASQYATQIGIDWKVGSENFNNGIVLLIKPKTKSSSGETFIAVGYGLEGAIPDAYAKRIVENELIPNFKKDDYFAGASSACDVLMKLASGEISEPNNKQSLVDNLLMWMALVFFISMVLMAIFAKRKGNAGETRNNATHGPKTTTSSSSKGFGGFGGGSFGGGGAGGKW